MHDLFTVESFDLEKTYEYILSIQVSLNGFSFSVSSSDKNELVYYKNVPRKISNSALLKRHLNEWFQNEELVKKPFRKINIIVFSEIFSLIPEQYYNTSAKSLLPLILFDNKKKFEIAENSIHHIPAKLMFALPPGINKTFQNYFEEYEIIHPIKLVMNNLTESTANSLVLLFDAQYFYAILYNQNRVMNINSFELAHVNDVVYFCLTMLNQSGISSKQTTLYISDIRNDSLEMKENLNKYFTEIVPLDINTEISGVQQKIHFTHLCGH